MRRATFTTDYPPWTVGTVVTTDPAAEASAAVVDPVRFAKLVEIGAAAEDGAEAPESDTETAPSRKRRKRTAKMRSHR
jgi:hypothetical protein